MNQIRSKLTEQRNILKNLKGGNEKCLKAFSVPRLTERQRKMFENCVDKKTQNKEMKNKPRQKENMRIGPIQKGYGSRATHLKERLRLI